MAEQRYVTSLYPDRASAEAAVDALVEAGFSRDDVNLVMTGATRSRWFAGPEPGEAIVGGGILGALLGGAIGLAAGAIPGGLVLAGPIAGLFGGLGVGGLSGSLFGALVEIGVPEAEARVYEERILAGEVVVGVQAHSAAEADKARAILEARKPTAAPVVYEPRVYAA